jgi:hypothetical protein
MTIVHRGTAVILKRGEDIVLSILQLALGA